LISQPCLNTVRGTTSAGEGFSNVGTPARGVLGDRELRFDPYRTVFFSRSDEGATLIAAADVVFGFLEEEGGDILGASTDFDFDFLAIEGLAPICCRRSGVSLRIAPERGREGRGGLGFGLGLVEALPRNLGADLSGLGLKLLGPLDVSSADDFLANGFCIFETLDKTFGGGLRPRDGSTVRVEGIVGVVLGGMDLRFLEKGVLRRPKPGVEAFGLTGLFLGFNGRRARTAGFSEREDLDLGFGLGFGLGRGVDLVTGFGFENEGLDGVEDDDLDNGERGLDDLTGLLRLDGFRSLRGLGLGFREWVPDRGRGLRGGGGMVKGS